MNKSTKAYRRARHKTEWVIPPFGCFGSTVCLFLFGGNMIEHIRKRFFLFVIGLIDKQHIGLMTKQSSTVVDCCIYIKDAIVTPR